MTAINFLQPFFITMLVLGIAASCFIAIATGCWLPDLIKLCVRFWDSWRLPAWGRSKSVARPDLLLIWRKLKFWGNK